MKRLLSIIILLLALAYAMPSAMAFDKDHKHLLPKVIEDSVRIRQIMEERVIVAGDTVGIILPERNWGRYDRGLYNFLFIPRGQWMFGLTASYGSLDTKDIRLLDMLKDLSFEGKQYSIRPTISYFIKSNTSVGLKLAYNRGDAHLGSMSVDFDDDLNFSLKDVSYQSNKYSIGVFYRNYVGLGTEKRFAVFNEVDLSFASGFSRFQRYYNNELRDTRTTSTSVNLNFSPGVCVFLMDYLSFNISFGVFGIHLTNEKQKTNDVEEGSNFQSGANFRFNLFNINFGIGVHI